MSELNSTLRINSRKTAARKSRIPGYHLVNDLSFIEKNKSGLEKFVQQIHSNLNKLDNGLDYRSNSKNYPVHCLGWDDKQKNEGSDGLTFLNDLLDLSEQIYVYIKRDKELSLRVLDSLQRVSNLNLIYRGDYNKEPYHFNRIDVSFTLSDKLFNSILIRAEEKLKEKPPIYSLVEKIEPRNINSTNTQNNNQNNRANVGNNKTNVEIYHSSNLIIPVYMFLSKHLLEHSSAKSGL